MSSISKITRAGQITLPKKIRTGRVFSKATAVVIEERKNEVVIKPLILQIEAPSENIAGDHLPFVGHTMRGWLDPENDNLFKIPGNL